MAWRGNRKDKITGNGLGGGGDVALGRGDVWCACRLKVRTRSPGCLATEVDLPRIVGGGIQARR